MIQTETYNLVMVLQIMILVIIFTMMVQIMIGKDILGIECKCRPEQKFLNFLLSHIIVEPIHQDGSMEPILYLKETLLIEQFASITVITFVFGQVRFKSNIVEISFCITWERHLYVIWGTVLNKRSNKTLLGIENSVKKRNKLPKLSSFVFRVAIETTSFVRKRGQV